MERGKEVRIPVPGYIEECLDAIARKAGRTREEVAVFFLAKGAGHALRCGVEDKKREDGKRRRVSS